MNPLKSIIPFVVCLPFIAGCEKKSDETANPNFKQPAATKSYDQQLHKSIREVVNQESSESRNSANKQLKTTIDKVKENFDDLVISTVRNNAKRTPRSIKSGVDVELVTIPLTMDNIVEIKRNSKTGRYESNMEPVQDLFNFIESKGLDVRACQPSGYAIDRYYHYKIYAHIPLELFQSKD